MENPFLGSDFQIRWTTLTPGHVVPAIEAALARAQDEIDAIATRDVQTLTFENTFLALEQATEELNTAWCKVTHLQSVADSPSLREAARISSASFSAIGRPLPDRAASTIQRSASCKRLFGRTSRGT